MATSEACPFCDIDETKNPIINANELMSSILSNPRLTSGHVLVVPNRHVELPTDLTAQESTAIDAEIKRLIKIMLAGLGDGVDTWQQTRPLVPQGQIKVDHVHFHILPSKIGEERYNSALRWSADQFSPLWPDEAREMQQRLRA